MDENPPIFDQLVALPTWTINNLMYPFLPANHLWKIHGRTPPLPIWTKWRTPVTTLFDTVFWLCGTMLFVLLVGMYFKSLVGA